MNFNQIAEIAGNQTTAMRRAEELVEVGLLERKPLNDPQGTVEYSLTERGERLVSPLSEILELEEG